MKYLLLFATAALLNGLLIRRMRREFSRPTPKPNIIPILGQAYEQTLFNFYYSAEQMMGGLPSLCATHTYVTLPILGELVEVEYSDAVPVDRNKGRSYWPDAILLGTATLDSLRCVYAKHETLEARDDDGE